MDGVADNYVDHILAAKKLFDLWNGYCEDLMSQTEFGGKLVRFFFTEASQGWLAELKAYSAQMPPMIERGEFWIPPSLLLHFKKMLILYRVKILEPIIASIQQKRTYRSRNPLNGGRPSDIGLQKLLAKAESAGVSASDLAAYLVAHGLDGNPRGSRTTQAGRPS